MKALAAMAVLSLKEGAGALAGYMLGADGEIFAASVKTHLREKESRQKCEQLIRQLVASEKFSSLSEVHPAWILEKLCEETPRVIGIILRYLPSKHVRFILKNLPPMIRAQIPNMVESFAVAAPVLEVIKTRFEHHFLPMRVSRMTARLGFENIYYLRGEEMEEVVFDTGLSILAMALLGMPPKTLHAVFNRLSLKDAKKLQQRIKESGDESPMVRNFARATLLEVDEVHVGPKKMFSGIGLAALALALFDANDALIGQILQRLNPDDGYLLKRLIEEKRHYPLKMVGGELKEVILASIARLSKEGRIDSAWRRFSPDSEVLPDPEEISEEISAKKDFSDEDTATVTQLA